jgi:hypothetical protein
MGTWTMETAMESERVHEMCRNGCDRQMRQSGSGREDVVSSRNSLRRRERCWRCDGMEGAAKMTAVLV